MNPSSQSPRRPPLLEVRRLTHGFRLDRRLSRPGRRTVGALQDVSFSVQRGEILGLAGESGSGKSTLARAIARLLLPDSGAVLLDGRAYGEMSTAERRAARRRIQLIFQDPSGALSPRRTIRQSLLEPLAHFGLGTRGEREAMAVEALREVDLEATALDCRPHEFSSGQRQRINIARALLAQPELIVADEAVSALDVSVQARILQLLARLRQRQGLSLLVISHDLAVIRQLADRVGVMLHGHLVELGPADEVFRRPAHPYTRQLLSAVPDPDPDNPSMPRPPGSGLRRTGLDRGCPFWQRCPEALPRCQSRLPGTHTAAADPAHSVKCHLYSSSHAPDANNAP